MPIDRTSLYRDLHFAPDYFRTEIEEKWNTRFVLEKVTQASGNLGVFTFKVENRVGVAVTP